MMEKMERLRKQQSEIKKRERMLWLQSISKLPKGVERMLERLHEKDLQMEDRRNEAGLEFQNYNIKAKSVPNFKVL